VRLLAGQYVSCSSEVSPSRNCQDSRSLNPFFLAVGIIFSPGFLDEVTVPSCSVLVQPIRKNDFSFEAPDIPSTFAFLRCFPPLERRQLPYARFAGPLSRILLVFSAEISSASLQARPWLSSPPRPSPLRKFFRFLFCDHF